MKRWLFQLTGAIVAAGLPLAVVADAEAETCTLELKRLESPMSVRSGPVDPTDNLVRNTYPQYFSMQIGGPQPYTATPGAAEFSKVVTKEPAEYASEHPFRGVAKLGSRQYGFVLDTKPSGSDAKDEEPDDSDSNETKPVAYARLFFDRNHNGDLTDDGVIEAETPQGIMFPSNYANATFPRVDLTVDCEGTKIEYSFLLSVYCYSSGDYQYGNASLNAAAYRVGEITLNGKPHRIVLIDFNSNGRFDDVFGINEEIQTPDNRIFPQYGDVLLVDPDSAIQGFRSPYDVTTSPDQYYVSKLIHLDGRYYDLEVTAGGDKLTLEPSSVPVGHVTNPNDGFRAVLYGDQGLVKVTGGKSNPAALPVGKWKLFAYTIDRTGYEEEEPADDEGAQEEPKTSLLRALTEALGSSAPRIGGPRFTLVSAQATRDHQPIEVREGETVALPFGPPFKPVVTVDFMQGKEVAQLGMSVVGSGGERCTALYVNGTNPEEPTFTIRTADGEQVEQGNFEWG
ncbi:MAG: hypothetical protein ACYTG0_06325 [Planctomycetota bacterium]|jgi:hypothetical protein